MNWTDDINYIELAELKETYNKLGGFDLFSEAQQAALGMYSEAKYEFSCSHISIDELHTIQKYLLSDLWRYND